MRWQQNSQLTDQILTKVEPCSRDNARWTRPRWNGCGTSRDRLGTEMEPRESGTKRVATTSKPSGTKFHLAPVSCSNVPKVVPNQTSTKSNYLRQGNTQQWKGQQQRALKISIFLVKRLLQLDLEQFCPVLPCQCVLKLSSYIWIIFESKTECRGGRRPDQVDPAVGVRIAKIGLFFDFMGHWNSDPEFWRLNSERG